MQWLRFILAPIAALALTVSSSAASSPASQHVWIISEENISFTSTDPGATGPAGYRRYVYQNTVDAPYFNGLISAPPAGRGSAVVTNLFSDVHSSFPVWIYFAMGAIPSSSTNEQCIDKPNIVRSVLAQGLTWRAYSEGMPRAGYQADNTTSSSCTDTTLFGNQCGYKRGHNPLINFTDTSASASNGGLPGGSCPESGQENNSLPMSQFVHDVSQASVANFVFITPDLGDDTHGSCSGCSFGVGHGLGHGNGSLKDADAWLGQVVPRILARAEFQQGGDGLLLIVWDEGNIQGGGNPPATSTDTQCGGSSDPKNCGGHIGLLAVGPNVKSTVISGNSAPYHFADVLHTICSVMALGTCPGAGASGKMIPLFQPLVPAPPTAVLAVSPSSGKAALLIAVDGTASHDSQGNGVARSLIDFGDGSTAAGPKAAHTYRNPGTYTVTLTVWDQSNLSATASTQVVVTSNVAQPPVAALSVTPTSGVAPLTVSASTAKSSDAGGSITSSIIDFGDGTVVSGTTIFHVYQTAGMFTITGTVRDNRGLSASATAQVNISLATHQPPVTELQVTPDHGPAPLTVTASTLGSHDTNQGTLSSILDFGDGTIVKASSASHQYIKAGGYTVTATGRNAFGLTSVATRHVEVSDPNADFLLNAAPQLNSKSHLNYQLTVRPLDPLYSPVSLSCSHVPTGMACLFTPPIVTPGQAPSFSMLTIAGRIPLASATPASVPLSVLWLPLAGLFLVSNVKRNPLQKRSSILFLTTILLLVVILQAGCGGGIATPQSANSSVPQQNTITVVASTGSRAHSIVIYLEEHKHKGPVH